MVIMQHEELNYNLVLFSVIVVIAALLLLFLGCCKYRLHKKNRTRLQIPHVKITRAPPLSLESPDIDFIDSKNTNLVSSTVRVTSVHDTPPNV